jgi:protein-S-isoprenylcysteine O-methyltransferase Ste14
MARDLGALTFILLIAMVLTRTRMLQTRGVTAMHFGSTDKSDFLIPPFALLYFYAICAGAFGWRFFDHAELFASHALHWTGAIACGIGLLLMAWSLGSFGTSFRVGIDEQQPGALITSGIFAFSRNPIYVAFGCVLLGEFLIQPTLLLLIYLVAGIALFHRQVLREEAFLEQHYGAEYDAYRKRVRRYL